MAKNTLDAKRRERFAQEYSKDGNGTQAAIRAGYAKRSAAVTASRLLREVKVKQRVDELAAEAAERAGLSAVLVREELRRIISFNIKMLFDKDGQPISLHQLPDEVAACISSVEYETRLQVDADGKSTPVRVTKVRFWSKTQALSDAARITGLMKDPKLTLEVNPLVELLQRISGNGSGLPYNASRDGSGSGHSHNAARDHTKGSGLQPRQ